MNEYVDKTVKIDPTAIIDRGAKIGKIVKYGNGFIFAKKGKIGSNCFRTKCICSQ